MGAYNIGLAYSVGDIVTITPGRFRNDLEATRAYIDTLARDVAVGVTNPRMTAGWKSGWLDFLMRWGGFYRDHSGSTTIPSPWIAPLPIDIPDAWLSSAFPNLTGSWQSIIRFGEEARQWAQSFRDLGGQRTTVPEFVPRQPTPPDLNPFQTTASPFMWGLLGLGVLFGVVALKRS